MARPTNASKSQGLYLKEQFQVLEQDYPGLHFIENPYYDSCNNISSLYAARDKL